MKKAVVKRRKNRLATPTARKVEGRTKLALMEFSPPHAPGGEPISYHKKVMLVSSFTKQRLQYLWRKIFVRHLI